MDVSSIVRPELRNRSSGRVEWVSCSYDIQRAFEANVRNVYGAGLPEVTEFHISPNTREIEIEINSYDRDRSLNFTFEAQERAF
jgi:hypothetical protein